MACPVNKIDSNVVGLAYAEEECVKVLPDATPDSGLEDGGVWWPLEPNEFDDFGGSISTLVRNPINQSRQRQKGVVSDLEAAGGFSQDMTQTNLLRLLQGFMFADAHERPGTHSLNTTTTTVSLQNIGAGAVLDVDTGEGSNFQAGDLLKLSGCSTLANNIDEIVIASIASDALTTDQTFGAETVDADNRLEKIGFEFGADDLTITYAANTITLGTSADDFTTMDLNVGEWIYVGGDAAGNAFTNNTGYCRIREINSTTMIVDEATWTPVTETTSGGEKVRLYFGTFLRNEKVLSLIKTRSYQLERTLGLDSNGTQSEYLVGALANEFTFNLATADKATCDLTFMAIDNEFRDGATDIKPGTRKTQETETAFNTSSDVKQVRLYKHGTTPTPAALFAHIMEGTITINNNCTPIKAIGHIGGFDVNVGDFEVGGELEVFFATVDAAQAIKDNADVGFNMILAKQNAGFVYDIPLLSLGGSGVTVEPNEPIKLSLEQFAAENEDGYTLGMTYFPHLPTVAI